MANEQTGPVEESGRRVLTGFSPDMVSQSGNQLVIKNKQLADLIESKFSQLAKQTTGVHPNIHVDVTIRVGAS